MPGTYFNPLKRIFLNLSGGTVTGDTVFEQGVYVSSLTGDTIFSGSTDLETVIYDIASSIAYGSATTLVTRVQPGTNITTGGTALVPIVSVVDSPFFSNLYSSGNSQFNNTTASTIDIEGDFNPTTDNNSDIGSPIKRFRSLNTVNGVAVNFTAETRVTTPEILLGNTIVNEGNIILSGYTLEGGLW